jgi:hypothetical protein
VVWAIRERLERPHLTPGHGGSLPHGVTRSDRPADPGHLYWALSVVDQVIFRLMAR